MTIPSVPKHRCAATGCHRQVLLKYLMCFEHWAMVPITVQKDVWNAFYNGKRKGIHPTDQYEDAVHAAIQSVAGQELKTRKGVQLELNA